VENRLCTRIFSKFSRSFASNRNTSLPDAIIEVITNGHGEKVQQAVEKIPHDVVVNNTSKETRVQPHFGSFNIAPKDTEEYRDGRFRTAAG